MHRLFHCSTECFVIALVYIDRLVKANTAITVGPPTCHRLLLTAAMLAVKFNDDAFYSNAYYARVGGLKVWEMNRLESQLLHMLDWRLQVSPEEFELYSKCISRHVLNEPGTRDV